MNCNEFETNLTAYMSGSLSSAECWRMEQHAAGCAACETLMESTTVRPVDAFAPVIPTELRARTLSAVVSRGRGRRAVRWVQGMALLAAASLAIVTLRPREKRAQPVHGNSVQDTLRRSDGAASALARAQSEFQALDDATRELQSALATAPNDRQLGAFLTSVNARRAELERRVKDARS